MERLISIIPESENEIRENQKKWEESLELSYKLVADNVDFNKVGREDYIGSFSNGELIQFRERAKYYLCLYYTIKIKNRRIYGIPIFIKRNWQNKK